jgi:hypothetical protein
MMAMIQEPADPQPRADVDADLVHATPQTH